ncbi:ArfGap-domain-containing protein [Microthyrium microscopicum]|uniref:ArfGap-domain-containing protein n=1 Tax=Microthyrium microscopicum TaxID=703497 RepID=A0A6A6UC62_9PEZI|nr:ArfGap-domain-containing protein [Microthyrium microscopicum]
MAAINKRQQVRNERTLQDLIKSVPGNDRCADCAARNPGWASWSLGIFLCVRCASIHRKLGVHVSKIKSLSMDSWTSEQVELMKKTGNTNSNRVFNPRNVKPSIPIDIDEVDGVMERYIRQKYESKTLSSESQPTSRQHTGSTGSSEDHAAPLPPKPSKRFTFGLRSTSSSFPLGRSERSPPDSPANGKISFGSAYKRPSAPDKKNKPSKIFGTDIGGSRQDNYELKLIALREMGFPDDKRNLTILKGESGNVDRAVATLIRLGEGSRMSSGRSSPAPETPPKDEFTPVSAGATRSLNPFDKLDLQDKALPPPPIEEHNQRPHTGLASPTAYNPFVQSTPSLEQNFQGLTVSHPSHLFPNATGGYNNTQSPVTTNPFLQTYTPPPTQQPSTMMGQFNAPAPFAPQQPQYFAQPQQYQQAPQQFQQPPQPSTSPNPFLSASPSNQFPSSNPFESQQNQYSATNNAYYPDMNNQQHMYQTQLQNQMIQHNNSFPQPMQQTLYQQQSASSPFGQQSLQMGQTNPFLMNAPQVHAQFTTSSMVSSPVTQSPAQQQGNPFDGQYQQYQNHAQTIPAPNRFDKASILALYNMPNSNSNQNNLAAPPNEQQQPGGARRSVTMPLPNTAQPAMSPAPTNPFAASLNQSTTAQSNVVANAAMAKPGVQSTFAHMSHESVDFSTMMNGRHSPDAFAALSSRLMR